MKLPLTVENLIDEARTFCVLESQHNNPDLFGVTDGKAIGTYIEHKFQTQLENYEYLRGSSAKGIDLPSESINTDIKVTSLKQPQSSSPFRSARQKIYGLGYNLLLFVYDKVDEAATATARLSFVNCTFIQQHRTGDFMITRMLRQMVENNANKEDIVAFLMDRNLPADEVTLGIIADEILDSPPPQGYITISNALQWRLQYTRIVNLADNVDGIIEIVRM
jgi:hypothetical protein